MDGELGSLFLSHLVTVIDGPQTDSEPHQTSWWAVAYRVARRSPGPSLAGHRSYENRLVAATVRVASRRRMTSALPGESTTRLGPHSGVTGLRRTLWVPFGSGTTWSAGQELDGRMSTAYSVNSSAQSGDLPLMLSA